MEAANDADAASKGWTPAMGSFGVNTYPNSGGGSGGGGGGGGGGQPPPVQGGGDLGGQIDKLLSAIASGNKQAFDETVREFNQTYGLDQAKFTEAVRQFNQGYQLSQAGVTGTYQGAPTLAALKQQADIAAQKLAGAQADASLTGTYQGQATLAALKQQADIASQQLQNAMTAAGLTGVYNGQQTQAAQAQQFGQGVTAAGLTGLYNGAPTLAAQQQAYSQQMGVINAAQTAQANPFRQQQLYGQAAQMFAGNPVPGFQAPGTVAGVGTAGGNSQGGLGYLSQMIDDIRSPQANQTSADTFLAQTPTPNKIDSQSFLRSNPSTQNLILNAMSERYGIDPKDALSQIQATLPQFTAPQTVGVVRRG
jgi:hypothetical protein